MISQFIPFTAYLIPPIILGVVAMIVFFLVRFLISLCIGSRSNSFSRVVLPALAAAFAIYLILPRLHKHADVVKAAPLGSNISSVIDVLGNATESYSTPGGANTHLYAEGYITGYTVIETNPNGTITAVTYAA